MPWKETSAMDQRIQFIGDWLSGRYSKTDLCQLYGISRPTGDKWIDRYQRFGPDGLKELSRAAKHHPNAVTAELGERIIQYKLRHQCFGPKKVMDGLRREEPGAQLASRQYGRGNPEAGRAGKCTPSSPARACSQLAFGPQQRPQYRLECGFQRGLYFGRWTALLPSDHQRQLQPLPFAVSRLGEPDVCRSSTLV